MSARKGILKNSGPAGHFMKSRILILFTFCQYRNVHLKPQGEIAIFNMWGSEMGKIAINEKAILAMFCLAREEIYF